ncbi:MAG: TSUP family transporter [Prolixibacteraceae bacterium]|nr:TSUP family transporter [Prolixibacteraceae bacterium]
MGHLTSGHFDASLAIPLAIAAALGGYLGTHLTVKVSPKKLKFIFAFTSLLAAIIMVLNI